jgi:hypothetical protein
MKGIYLTKEGKKEIEAKIAELEDYTYATQDLHLEGNIQGHLYCLKEILSSATILPVEESWGNMPIGVNESELSYPQGVIIQPK